KASESNWSAEKGQWCPEGQMVPGERSNGAGSEVTGGTTVASDLAPVDQPPADQPPADSNQGALPQRQPRHRLPPPLGDHRVDERRHRVGELVLPHEAPLH